MSPTLEAAAAAGGGCGGVDGGGGGGVGGGRRWQPTGQTITQSPILRPLTPLNRSTGESDAGGQCACRRRRRWRQLVLE